MPYTSDWKEVPWYNGREPWHPYPKCEAPDVVSRTWESSDGGHEDWHYKCRHCGKSWWVDGIDA